MLQVVVSVYKTVVKEMHVYFLC